MQKISDAIKEGAEAFLRRQNRTIGLLAVLLAALIFVLYGFVRSHHDFDPVRTSLGLAFWTTLSFLLGAGCSVFAGYVGMWISIRSNIRTASAARSSLNDALRIALRGGAVSGLLVVSMSLFGVGGLYWLVRRFTEVPLFPLVARAFGLLASIVGIIIVKTREDQDPMQALNRGYYVAAALAIAGFFAATKWLLANPSHPDAWWKYFLCGVIGVLASV